MANRHPLDDLIGDLEPPKWKIDIPPELRDQVLFPACPAGEHATKPARPARKPWNERLAGRLVSKDGWPTAQGWVVGLTFCVVVFILLCVTAVALWTWSRSVGAAFMVVVAVTNLIFISYRPGGKR